MKSLPLVVDHMNWDAGFRDRDDGLTKRRRRKENAVAYLGYARTQGPEPPIGLVVKPGSELRKERRELGPPT